jgi:hypothetical protein
MTDPIKAKIQELCPDVIEKYNRCMGCGYGFDFRKKGKTCPITQRELPITLAVVLRAIGLERFGNNDDIRELIYGYVHSWDMLHDNYDQQSEECKQFIGSLII